MIFNNKVLGLLAPSRGGPGAAAGASDDSDEGDFDDEEDLDEEEFL